jgi:hypothetical protein
MRELLCQSNDPSNPGAPIFKPDQQQIIVQSNLYELLQDPFGNYVLQTCLAEGAIKCPTEYVTMVQLISPFVQKLQQNSNTNKKISQLLNFSNNPAEQPNRPEKESRQNYNNNNQQHQQQHHGNKHNNNQNNNNNNQTNNQNYNNQQHNMNPNYNPLLNNPGNPNYYFVPNMGGNFINFVPNNAYLPNNPNFGQPPFGNFHPNNLGNNNYNLGGINPNMTPGKMNNNPNKIKMNMMDPSLGGVHLNPLHKINSYDHNVDNSRDTVISASPQISLVYPSYASTSQQNERMGNGRMNSKNTGQKQNSNSGNNNANNRNNNNNNSNNSNNNNTNNNNMGQQQQHHNKKRNNANPMQNQQKQQV